MSPTIKRTVTKTEETHIAISRTDIIALIPNCPPDAEIYFRVPSGENWSNTNIDICSDNPVHVTWKKVETVHG